MINFLYEANAIKDILVEIRRELHKNPEIDRNLKYTASLVEKYLKQYSIDYKRYDNCGIIAEIGKSDKIVALRADMDALEIEDLKDKPYSSIKKGLMHACGHDAHTAIQIGAAIILKKYESKLNGKVRLIFQPAEETDGGAKDMINFGALDNVRAIYALHVDETLDTGVIGVKKGLVAAASNPFKISIFGKGAHGAYPHDGIDSIYIAAKVIDGIQGIISREVAAADSAVITVGKIHGGTAANAVARNVDIEGIIRTVGDDLRQFVLSRFKEVVIDTSRIYRGIAEVDIFESYPSFSNDDILFNDFIKFVGDINEIKLIEIQKPGMGVEDFAYYTKLVPGLYYKLGCRNVEKGIVHPAHGSYFDIDEDCLALGSATQTMCAFNYLNSHK
ncbi:putative hydrolase YxeP [Caloramator mitchellensis]|uniref:Putative hydrolase YxeP n=1 Tax=Caloramator mitchellensis TaxID=908809 RepID=A0A0R3JU17_CALMK|nr:amidohydrolase [Caloramator mitchellensis]KRQ87033.1 putative hydrolase YxeP [Caloramator mitchellensis]